MFTFRIKVFLLLLLSLSITQSAFSAPATGAKEINNFAFKLLYTSKQKNSNLFFSPYSIAATLAMLYPGAAGNTQRQIGELLQLSPAACSQFFSTSTLKIAGFTGSNQVDIAIANALWSQEGYRILDSYTSILKQNFSAFITPLDFKEHAREATETINRWVETETRNRIRNLIPEGSLDTATRLVLTSAIYFKGQWEFAFDKNATSDRSFHPTSSETTSVPTMILQADLPYFEDARLQAIELPYQGAAAAMMIILPKNGSTLRELEDSIGEALVTAILKDAEVRKVDLSLPKFNVTSDFSLNEQLIALGMTDAFNRQKADFSGIDGKSDNLFIGVALHKAFLELSEDGTEASAATAISMKMGATMPSPMAQFKADHPFLILIRDKQTDAILFIGRIANPLH